MLFVQSVLLKHVVCAKCVSAAHRMIASKPFNDCNVSYSVTSSCIK